MNTDFVTPILSLIAIGSSILLAVLYNRMDARYVQISSFNTAQAQIVETQKSASAQQTKDHETRDKKLDDIHGEVKKLSEQVGKISEEMAYQRGRQKGNEDK